MSVASSPNTPDNFMREVDDAVRDDALRNFGSRFGRIIAVIVVAGLLALGGWLFWQSRAEAASGERGRQFGAVIDQVEQSRPKAAGVAAARFARGDDPTYRALALMIQGNAAVAAGDARTAATRFGAVANDTAVTQGMRDVAILRQTLVEFDTLTPAAVVARLRGLVAGNGPAFGSAAELTAIAEMRRGNTAAAGQLFRRIAQAEGVADSLKSRAVQMAGMLGVDAVVTSDGVAPAATATAPAARPAAGAVARPAAPAEATKE
jgi:hypothetical protein